MITWNKDIPEYTTIYSVTLGSHISIDRCLMIWVRFYMKHSFNRKYKYPRRRGWRWLYQFYQDKLYSVVIENIFCVHLSLIFLCLSLFGCMYEYGPKYIVVFITPFIIKLLRLFHLNDVECQWEQWEIKEALSMASIFVAL